MSALSVLFSSHIFGAETENTSWTSSTSTERKRWESSRCRRWLPHRCSTTCASALWASMELVCGVRCSQPGGFTQTQCAVWTRSGTRPDPNQIRLRGTGARAVNTRSVCGGVPRTPAHLLRLPHGRHLRRPASRALGVFWSFNGLFGMKLSKANALVA